MKNKLNNCNSSDEQLAAEIAVEIQNFLIDELDLANGYEFYDCLGVNQNNPLRSEYTCYVVLSDPDDAEDNITAFRDNKRELLDHLSHQFPGVKFSVKMTMNAPEVFEDDMDDEDDRSYSSFEDEQVEEDDGPADDEDEQYREEGMRIIEKLEDEKEELDERDKYDPDELPEDEDADGVDSLIEEDEADEYTPDDEDKEELWRTFGDFDEADQ